MKLTNLHQYLSQELLAGYLTKRFSEEKLDQVETLVISALNLIAIQLDIKKADMALVCFWIGSCFFDMLAEEEAEKCNNL